MAINLSTGHPGKLLAVGILIVFAFSIWVIAITPALDIYSNQQEQLTTLRLKIKRATELIDALPQLAKAVNLTQVLPAYGVLPGDTDAISDATLQEIIQTLASEDGAQLTSIETLPGEMAGDYRRVGVRVELSARFNAIISLFAAIEKKRPTIFIDDIRLTSTPTGFQNGPSPLDATFSVYAFRTRAPNGVHS